MRRVLALGLVLVFAVATVAQGPLKLPESAKPHSDLKPFEFIVGRWVGVNPNSTVNEEHWTTPRGNHMVGVFRQVRRDGRPAFVETSLISVEKGGIELRLRHLHGALEVPESRKEANVFKLVKAEKNRVEFAGTGDAEGVTSVVYRLVKRDQLEMQVGFAPGSREKGFTSTYYRSRN